MIIIQIKISENSDEQTLKNILNTLLPQIKGVECAAVLDDKEYGIKKIPVYTPEQLTNLYSGSRR